MGLQRAQTLSSKTFEARRIAPKFTYCRLVEEIRKFASNTSDVKVVLPQQTLLLPLKKAQLSLTISKAASTLV